jgi:F-type H+-transporting ATPase subunit epsilon
VADASVLEVAVVSAERLLWQGQAKSIVAKTPEGEIGILPGHEPVLSLLVESPLRIEDAPTATKCSLPCMVASSRWTPTR